MKRDAFNVRYPMFRPLWVRLLVCAVMVAWTVVEFVAGQAVFGIIAGLSGAYLMHQFFWVFDPSDYERKDQQ